EASIVHIHFSAAQSMVLYVIDIQDFINDVSNLCSPVSSRFQSTPVSSGDFDVNLTPADNPYVLFIMPANMQNIVSPTFSLTIGPVSNVPNGSTQLPFRMTSTSMGT